MCACARGCSNVRELLTFNVLIHKILHRSKMDYNVVYKMMIIYLVLSRCVQTRGWFAVKKSKCSYLKYESFQYERTSVAISPMR